MSDEKGTEANKQYRRRLFVWGQALTGLLLILFACHWFDGGNLASFVSDVWGYVLFFVYFVIINEALATPKEGLFNPKLVSRDSTKGLKGLFGPKEPLNTRDNLALLGVIHMLMFLYIGMEFFLLGENVRLEFFMLYLIVVTQILYNHHHIREILLAGSGHGEHGDERYSAFHDPPSPSVMGRIDRLEAALKAHGIDPDNPAAPESSES
jgi:hypothetical protein